MDRAQYEYNTALLQLFIFITASTTGLVTLISIPAATSNGIRGVELVPTLLLLCVTLMVAAVAGIRFWTGISDTTDGSSRADEDESEPEFWVRELSGEELVANATHYPRVGEYLLTRITRVYSPAASTDIVVDVDLPTGSEGWTWEYPLSWDPDESRFVRFVDAYGLSRDSFDELEGKPVLVKCTQEKTALRLTPPAESISEWIENGDISWNEIQLGAIQEQFDLDLTVDDGAVDSTSGIIVDELPDEFNYGE